MNGKNNKHLTRSMDKFKLEAAQELNISDEFNLIIERI